MTEQRDLTPAEIAKIEAETAAANALADFHRANAALAASGEAKNYAEARAFDAECGGREAQTAVALITQQNMERDQARYLSSDAFHNVYRFTGAVTDDSVKVCMKTLTEWSRLDRGAPMEIIFYSPGGSVTAGLALWDFLQEIRSRGHHLTTVIQGIAASMAGILSQAGDVRAMGKESWLMIHEVSFGAQGKIGEVEDTTEWVKKVQERVLRIFESRSNLSLPKLRAMWLRKDAWVSSDEALKMGLIDVVR